MEGENSKKRRNDMEDPAKEEEDPALDIMTIFTIQLVTDCIFNGLQHSDVLSCSEVSKYWHTLARDYLRRRRQNLLKCQIIDNDLNSLQQRLDLLSIENSNYPKIFNGIHILIEGIASEKFDFESPDDWQTQTKAQLKNIFELFPMKNLIVEFKNYSTPHLRVTFYALEFIFSTLPEDQLETLKITGHEDKDSGKFLWKHLPIKRSSKLKSVQMDDKEYDLPLEVKPLVGSRKNNLIMLYGAEDDRLPYGEFDFNAEVTNLFNLFMRSNADPNFGPEQWAENLEIPH